jgi:hypothetical protein
MKKRIEGYQNFPGEHCGSVAMRGLLEHYCGLELPEGAIFGLGAGVACVTIEGPILDPPAVVFGRTTTMEVDLAAALGIDYREQTETDDAKAWEKVREEVLAGRPTMLSGDIFYLDYRDYKVHFPAHRFVLLGFDDESEKALIADRINVAPEVCSLGALMTSRNPPEGMSTHNLWGKFHGTEVRRDLPAAAREAIRTCATRMLDGGPEGGSADEGGGMEFGADVRVTTGIEGIRRLRDALPEWGERDDAHQVARFNASCIEKFGNGGGNFRRLYADFLAWARDLEPGLVPEDASARSRQAADGWTALSEVLAAASEEGSSPGLWKQAAGHAGAVAELEETLFRSLADRVA